ncbi:uncharacterized protein LOC119666282 [Teleopsis dalmanni]|uniref:uncharacterized protein LOC119666282 n=1 Tax=Teleopsis dalmanni TaxID=139649 RepID=UPI0018CF16CF|nr:uncharacterized protein LOC119666282 [Teleopsis dalmanni]
MTPPPLNKIEDEDENRYLRIKKEILEDDGKLNISNQEPKCQININNNILPENLTAKRHEAVTSPTRDGAQNISSDEHNGDYIPEEAEVPIDKDNPLKCTACGEIFQNHFHLKTHYQNVHLKLHHKCNIDGCNAAFPSKRSRDRHSSNLNLHRKLLSTSDNHHLDPLPEPINANNNKNQNSQSAPSVLSNTIQAEFLARLYASSHSLPPLNFESLKQHFPNVPHSGHAHTFPETFISDPRLLLNHPGNSLLFPGLTGLPGFPHLAPHILASPFNGLNPFCRRSSTDSHSPRSLTPPITTRSPSNTSLGGPSLQKLSPIYSRHASPENEIHTGSPTASIEKSSSLPHQFGNPNLHHQRHTPDRIS